jgi:hypothetical protein
MKNIENWLKENHISYTSSKRGIHEYIVIVLEKDLVWVNGFHKKMLWDHTISIFRNGSYKYYLVAERTGYNMSCTRCRTGKQSEVVCVLEKLLK